MWHNVYVLALSCCFKSSAVRSFSVVTMMCHSQILQPLQSQEFLDFACSTLRFGEMALVVALLVYDHLCHVYFVVCLPSSALPGLCSFFCVAPVPMRISFGPRHQKCQSPYCYVHLIIINICIEKADHTQLYQEAQTEGHMHYQSIVPMPCIYISRFLLPQRPETQRASCTA